MQSDQQKSKKIDFRVVQFPIEDWIQFQSAENHKLHTYRFLSKQTTDGQQPKGVVIMLHGYGSYVGKFAYIAQKFTEQGYDFVGYDFQGFGKSEGTRGLIKDTNNFLTDGYFFLKKVREYYKLNYKDSNIPMISFGYSLGGAGAVGIERIFGTNGDTFDAHLLVVPNMGVDKALQAPEEKVKELKELAKNKPDYPLFPFAQSEEEFLKEYYEDELQYKGQVLAGTFICSMIEIAEDNQKWAENFSKPVMIAQGKHDKIVSVPRVEEFFNKIKSSNDVKEMKLYDTEHYIMSDGFVYEDVINDQISWLNKVLK